MVLVGEDVVLQDGVGVLDPRGLIQVPAGHAPDGDLVPEQDPVLVGHLLHCRVQGVVGADQGRPDLLRPRHQLLHLGNVERRAVPLSLFVEVHASQIEQVAVERQAPIRRDGDRPYAAVGEVAAELPALRIEGRERGVVEVRVTGGPQPRMPDGGGGLCGPGRMGGDRGRAEVELGAAVGTGQGHRLWNPGDVAHERLVLDRGRTARTRLHRPDLDLRDVNALCGTEVDVAEDAAEVPPPSDWPGRQVSRRAAVVDADDQPVDTGTEAL